MKRILLYIVFAISMTAIAQESPISRDENTKIENLKLYKEKAHASYYHDKFTGRKTASGKRFDNNKLTAAHKKLPFGTKLKITNVLNKKSTIVEVTDRGPFVKGREIDLSKKAFMDIASNKNSGAMNVKIEILVN
ncbi:septal ring lytic transglycosylase RlpA family protein [Flavobacterium piscisymbiosum]|uniref:Probable endolytic peptidoglycan transglycosylase RlpA n=1 Tax=Flavobacterium piscisymbiosum TaxID=2893753 RepID=A0ABS8M834_9FLAO|nr:septal ring lytic transglycosylase RlpA family protein [Flavobacterium sp. F-30]MCC9061607.1 septal ring lytic transglycosylase RlpA family protein [Flavobacterium sp. F-30]